MTRPLLFKISENPTRVFTLEIKFGIAIYILHFRYFLMFSLQKLFLKLIQNQFWLWSPTDFSVFTEQKRLFSENPTHKTKVDETSF